jgi:hypothetical protein
MLPRPSRCINRLRLKRLLNPEGWMDGLQAAVRPSINGPNTPVQYLPPTPARRFALGTSQAKQIDRLAPNALRPS